MSLRSSYSDGTPVIAYVVATADGDLLAERSPDEPFYAASTVKLAVLAAAVRMLESGEVGLDTPLVSQDTFASQVPGAPDYRLVPDDVDHGMAPAGDTMPLTDVLERMIVVSSNEATNMVLDLVGLDAVARALDDAGADGVRMGRRYGDFAAAERDGMVNVVTAAGLARLMAAVVAGRLAGPRWTTYMTDMLARQQDPLLAAGMPAGSVWGSKSGSVDAIRHDVAYLGRPGPDALVVAVCTRGYPIEDADEVLKALGSLAVSLAPRP